MFHSGTLNLGMKLQMGSLYDLFSNILFTVPQVKLFCHLCPSTIMGVGLSQTKATVHEITSIP